MIELIQSIQIPNYEVNKIELTPSAICGTPI